MMFFLSVASLLYNVLALVYLQFVPHSVLALAAPKQSAKLARIFPASIFPVDEEGKKKGLLTAGAGAALSLFYLFNHHEE